MSKATVTRLLIGSWIALLAGAALAVADHDRQGADEAEAEQGPGEGADAAPRGASAPAGA